jgi:hypothetical protein
MERSERSTYGRSGAQNTARISKHLRKLARSARRTLSVAAAPREMRHPSGGMGCRPAFASSVIPSAEWFGYLVAMSGNSRVTRLVLEEAPPPLPLDPVREISEDPGGTTDSTGRRSPICTPNATTPTRSGGTRCDELRSPCSFSPVVLQVIWIKPISRRWQTGFLTHNLSRLVQGTTFTLGNHASSPQPWETCSPPDPERRRGGGRKSRLALAQLRY